jgi:RNA polymerase sigma-70 factor, ECF subfamily
MRLLPVGLTYAKGKKIVMQHFLPSSSEELCDRQGPRGDAMPLVEHLGAAYNLARWLMRNEAEAEDLVQEAYLRAISHLAGFSGGDRRTWLLTIVRNTGYSRLRQKGGSGQNTDFNEAVHSVAGRQTPNPETVLLQAERSELVRKLLEELPAEHREVIVLRELEQFSYREIADIVGIPLGTVMSRLSRARQQLQQTLVGRNSHVSALQDRLPC